MVGNRRKLIVTVIACQKNLDRLEAIRRTWGKENVVFLIGGSDKDLLIDDILYLDIPDDYLHTPQKQIKGIQYLSKLCDYTFNCDDDTYVDVNKLENCEYENYDYMGAESENYDGSFKFAYGGSGFFLSHKAMYILSKLDYSKMASTFVLPPLTDVAIGHIMHLFGIKLKDDKRFYKGKYIGDKKEVFFENNEHIVKGGNGLPVVYPTNKNKLITTHFVTTEMFEKIYKGEIENKYKIMINDREFEIEERDGEWWSGELGPFDFPQDIEMNLFSKPT